MAIFQVAGTAVLLPQFSPEAFWKAYLSPPQKTLLALTPNLLAAVLAHPLASESRNRDPALWLIGGDRTPAHLHKGFNETVKGELIETCGMTETGPYAMNPPFKPKKIGSVGVAPIGVLLRLVDSQENDVLPGEIGQVVVRTPDTMVGYWNDTLATYEVLRDGWMRTGDLARADEDGYLWLEGRLKEMIVRDGANVSPLEVESLALEQIEITGAACIGKPDALHGESVHLFATTTMENSADAERQLMENFNQKLRPSAIPERIHWLSELPRNLSGKVDRTKLRQILRDS
jgi:long-chain acyl-CoA synthetase